ncbi:hypothetical protein FLONG3_2515 [Fusarium longipes]|uniref:Uncharacterized protein n=1 Tax=Fusarium longipes TaxID=694270 RepID=A0A395T3U4_9HYPO|nr:hypothetical protein FLONG3_2515 [Fusarium longipes]
MISDTRLETHYRGKKIILRVLTPLDRMTAVMAIMEDKKGTAVLLQLYHQPKETNVPATEILGPKMVCILKEPFFKCAMDGIYSLRVDHLGDIIRLDGADDRIPSHWRLSLVILDENSIDIRKQGNDASLSAEFGDLYHADYQKAMVLETDGTPVVDTSVFQKRKVLTEGLQRLFYYPGLGNEAKAIRLIKALEETYPINNDCALRLELWEPFFAFGAHQLKNNQLNNAAKMILKGLEALGNSIIACPPSDITDRPRLEVQKWGVPNDAVPWAFYNLANVYRQLAPELCLAAEHYAEVSYTMVVGEKETWPEVFSSSS